MPSRGKRRPGTSGQEEIPGRPCGPRKDGGSRDGHGWPRADSASGHGYGTLPKAGAVAARVMTPGVLLLVWLAGGGALAHSLPSLDEVKRTHPPSEGILYDRHHEILHEKRVDYTLRRLEWTPLEAISPLLSQTLILAEDKRFWTHGGVDAWALAASLVQNLWSGQRRGASTITMQLAGVLAQNPKTPKVGAERRGVWAKLKQMQAAWQIEESWSKEAILEAYLNLVSFRGELRGITAASYGLFAKAPHSLDTAEASVLAVLVRSPGASPQRVEARSCQLAARLGFRESCIPIRRWLAGGGLKRYAIRPKVALAPHAAEQILTGSETVSTIDRALQVWLIDTLTRHLLAAAPRNVHDAAALVLDNSSGEVLAYVGGLDELSSARYVDGVRAKRQAGSTLKPFVYALAFDKRYLTPASSIEDAALDLAVPGGVYRPRNYNREFYGRVSVREALASSLNVPAVKALTLVGVDTFVRTLHGLGFTSLRRADYYGPSLALGAADVTLWELVNAYRTLAKAGLASPAYLRKPGKLRPAVSERVFSPEAAFLTGDILADRSSRALSFGLENPLASPFWTAVKTGTSQDMRDIWCLGYSSRYTVGVWMGNFSGEPMWSVSGISGAAPAWADVMRWLHRDLPSTPPRPPSGLRQVAGDWWIRGTEPPLSVAWNPDLLPASAHRRARISYPLDGMVLAEDPDIAPGHERLFFEAEPPRGDLRWRLNGKLLPSRGSSVHWPVIGDGGDYTLELCEGEAGPVLDTVHFALRASSKRPA